MANPNPKPPPKHSQFKPGNRANPIGGHAHNKASKALRKITLPKYREVVELVVSGTLDDLKRMADSNDALKSGIARAFYKAIRNGDYDMIERIAQRIIGKIPDVLEVTNLNVTPNDDQLDIVKVKAALKKFENDV
jgi:hypothetical protein